MSKTKNKNKGSKRARRELKIKQKTKQRKEEKKNRRKTLKKRKDRINKEQKNKLCHEYFLELKPPFVNREQSTLKDISLEELNNASEKPFLNNNVIIQKWIIGACGASSIGPLIAIVKDFLPMLIIAEKETFTPDISFDDFEKILLEHNKISVKRTELLQTLSAIRLSKLP